VAGLALAVVVAVGVVLLVVVPDPAATLSDPERLREWLRDIGPWGPVAFVLLQAVQVVVAPIPGHVLGLASGYVFGTVLGTLYSLFGAAIGTSVAIAVARRYGRPLVDRLVPSHYVAEFSDLTRRRGLAALFVVFLVPGLPDDVVCFVAGIADIDIRKAVAVSVVGRAPGFYLVNLAGAEYAAGRTTSTATVVAAVVVVALLVAWRREALLAWLSSSDGREPSRQN
jgi:uncharacterized membrane protein YdjX (TVP38/TMEM64 family)